MLRTEPGATAPADSITYILDHEWAGMFMYVVYISNSSTIYEFMIALNMQTTLEKVFAAWSSGKHLATSRQPPEMRWKGHSETAYREIDSNHQAGTTHTYIHIYIHTYIHTYMSEFSMFVLECKESQREGGRPSYFISHSDGSTCSIHVCMHVWRYVW